MATDINNNFDLESDAISEVYGMKFGLVVSTWNKNITAREAIISAVLTRSKNL